VVRIAALNTSTFGRTGVTSYPRKREGLSLNPESSQRGDRTKGGRSQGGRFISAIQAKPKTFAALAIVGAAALVATFVVLDSLGANNGSAQGPYPASSATALAEATASANLANNQGTSPIGAPPSLPGQARQGTVAASPVAPGGDSQATAEGPTETLAKGVELAPVKSPPDKTLAAIKVPDDFSSGSYAITFEPYGWGPGGPESGRVVIRIVEATPDDKTEALVDISGRNAIVSADGHSIDALKTGGRYEATLLVRSTEPERGELYISEVRPAK